MTFSLLLSGAFPVGGGVESVVLSFQSLYSLYLLDASRVEDLFVLYTMKKTKENAYFFAVKAGRERLIVNLAGRHQS